MALAAEMTLLSGRYRLIESPIISTGEAELWICARCSGSMTGCSPKRW